MAVCKDSGLNLFEVHMLDHTLFLHRIACQTKWRPKQIRLFGLYVTSSSPVGSSRSVCVLPCTVPFLLFTFIPSTFIFYILVLSHPQLVQCSLCKSVGFEIDLDCLWRSGHGADFCVLRGVHTHVHRPVSVSLCMEIGVVVHGNGCR